MILRPFLSGSLNIMLMDAGHHRGGDIEAIQQQADRDG
jgi:hypothetical protein